MAFELFGQSTRCDIKVGYISTDRGYVDGISRYDANKYAQLNPGTQFIVKNRDIIRYLNINEVNRLEPEDIVPKVIPTNGCEDESKNTFGLDIYNPDGSLNPDATGTPGTPRIYINGGGGVGAVANPVIGNDGSLLAVDLVDGGYGYRFEPQVNIVDLDGVGAGAVAIASLCPPDKVGTFQTFENEDDFEEYDFNSCAPEITDFGRRFGANGEDLGEWEPSLYATLRNDPIKKEIDAYQKFLNSIGDGWWNTRKAKPIEIISKDNKGLTKFDVQHWAWSGSREVKKIPNKKENFREVDFKVYTQGGQDRDLMFTFIEKNGDHKFKIKADTYPDGAKGQKVKIKVKTNSVYTVNASGRFRGKGVEQGLLKNFGANAKELDKKFTDGTKIFADFIKSSNDNDDLQIEATQGKFKSKKVKSSNRSTFELTYEVEDSGQFRAQKKVSKKIDDSFMNSYAISPVPPSNVPGSDFAGIQYSFIYEENFPYDGEYVFKAMADNVGEVYIDNELIFFFRKFKGSPDTFKQNIKAGVHKVRCDVYNVPQYEKVEPTPSANIISELSASSGSENQELLIDYRNLHPKNKKLQVSGDRKRINFSDGDGKFNDSDLQILEGDAVFSKDGKKLIGQGRVKVRFSWYENSAGDNGIAVEKIKIGNRLLGSNRDLSPGYKEGQDTDVLDLDKNKRSKSKSKSTGSTGDKPEVIFDTLNYIDKADRKLWRINPNPGRDSDFLNRFGVLPFNPAAVEREKTLVPIESPPQPPPKASIVRDGSELFLKVTGGGRVKIDFSLKVNDSVNTSGVFAREVIIKTDDNDLKLRRDIRELFDDDNERYFSGKSKETITGSGVFSGGKTYPIKLVGSSPTTGFKTIDKTTVGFDDNIKNGYDENGLLRITNAKILQELDARYETKQNQVTKVVKRYPQKPNASTDAYAGIHVIRWESIDFPVDGNYSITTMVDDNAKIFIGNVDGAGRKAIGNGLRNIGDGGDEVIIEKQGFLNASSTGKSVDTKFFKKGKYRIRVELEQIPGKPLAKGNPMAIAIQIKTPRPEIIEVISARSWNQNPMGVALTIDPPIPPIPQEPKPVAPGRCPNNPIWTTRFTNADKEWWPVTHASQNGTKTWSKFMNRFATSPVPPLSTKGSANGGVLFTNTWNLDIPYDGFYGMKGTVDNGGRILVDNKVILEGGYFSESAFIGKRTLEGFNVEKPRTVKFPLTKGNHTITVEVENRSQTKQKRIKKTIFNTADWAVERAIPVLKDITYDVVYIGLHPRNKKLKVSGDRKRIDFSDADGKFNDGSLRIMSGDATFSDNGRKISGKGVIKARLKWDDNPNVDGVAIEGVIINGVRLTRGSVSITGNKTFPIEIAAPGTKNRGPRAQIVPGGVSNKEIQFTDADFQNDTDSRFSIESTSPGVSAKFSPDGKQLLVKGTGNVTLRLGWSESPSSNNQAVGELKVAGKTFRQTIVRKGEIIQTIKVDKNTVNQLSKSGDDTKNIDLGAKSASGRGLTGGTTKRGVTYSGPELTSYKSGSLGPFITPRYKDDQDYLANFNGTTWNMTWTGVDFPVSGRYRIRSEADDILTVKIDGASISEVKVREGVREINFNATQGKRTIEMELTNIDLQRTFQTNPTVFNAIIDIDGNIDVPAEKSWVENPIGISAILIPPPCPLETKGLGKVCDIIPLEPGNGYVAPPGPGYPAVLEIIQLIPVNPGINYSSDDAVCIIKEDGSKVCFSPNLDPFGANLPIDIVGFPIIGTPPPDIVPQGSSIGIPITEYPNIVQSSPTGVNSRFRPVVRVRRDPLDIEPENILQVTDLVGLKRTGYVDGREYFGAVFYKDGVRFAGYYETTGQLIQVYDTLQESIDGEVTTRPSAILRQGTDITSNDPRLNIPGTPENLT